MQWHGSPSSSIVKVYDLEENNQNDKDPEESSEGFLPKLCSAQGSPTVFSQSCKVTLILEEKTKMETKTKEKKTTNHFLSWKIVTGSIWCYLGSVAKQRNKVIECFAWKQRLKFICPLSWALQSLLSHWDMNFFFFVSCQSFDPAETEEFVLKWEADVERGKTKWSNMSLSEWFHKI